jgi:DNA-binding transcriptional regulator LsrR (DeoR family)
MVDPEIVRQLRALHALGWGSKRIAQELGISRNSVQRYVSEGTLADTQVRPKRARSTMHSGVLGAAVRAVWEVGSILVAHGGQF